MKKGFAVFAVLLLLSLSQVTQAVTLEEGWYVKLGYVALYGFDPIAGHDFALAWNFTDPLGTSGPFSVTQLGQHWPQRMISVSDTATDVLPGTCVDLYGEPVATIPAIVSEVSFRYETDYVASLMRLDLLMQAPDGNQTLLWSQNTSGFTWSEGNALEWNQIIPVGYIPVFRVTVVPEPSAFAALGLGLGILCAARRRIC